MRQEKRKDSIHNQIDFKTDEIKGTKRNSFSQIDIHNRNEKRKSQTERRKQETKGKQSPMNQKRELIKKSKYTNGESRKHQQRMNGKDLNSRTHSFIRSHKTNNTNREGKRTKRCHQPLPII